MGISFKPVGFDRAEKRLEDEGMDVMKESADAGIKLAHTLAPEDQGELKEKLGSYRTDDGAEMRADAPHSFFLEWGTGTETEPGAPGGTRRQTPWTYLHPRWGYTTTSGGKPQPYFRDGFDEAVDQFSRSKKRRGL